MATFDVEGTVPTFSGDQFDLPADDGRGLLDFYRSQGIDTIPAYSGGKPVVTVSAQKFVSASRPGMRVRYTIEVCDWRRGRGIRGVRMEPLRT